jgi:hypothetical protein
MAVTRFMADLDVNLVQGQNTAAVDTFGARWSAPPFLVHPKWEYHTLAI